MIRLQAILLVLGTLAIALAAAMLLPAALAIASGEREASAFALSALATGFIGGVLVLGSRGEVNGLGLREGFLVTVGSWLAACVLSALPLFFTDEPAGFVNSLFEAVSGLTTTGATVIVDLNHAPRSVLLWRSLLQWIGGVGIVVMAVALLPMLRIGGMQLLRIESSDRSDKLYPKAHTMAAAIGLTYLGLSVLSAIALMATGMGWFDAINHAMAAIATGGFSTKDDSVGHFDNWGAEAVLIATMVAGALPLLALPRLLARRSDPSDRQIRPFLLLLAAAVGGMSLWLVLSDRAHGWHALRIAAFNVTSMVTTTGFATDDFSKWGGFAMAAFFFFYFVGGCTGSTTGSVKMFRWQILLVHLKVSLLRLVEPHRVVPLHYGGRPVSDALVQSVADFAFAYLLTFALLSLLLGLCGQDVLTATTAVATAMASAGPGLGSAIGPAGTFAPLGAPEKLILCAAMLLGRLELLAVMVLFTPAFWRR